MNLEEKTLKEDTHSKAYFRKLFALFICSVLLCGVSFFIASHNDDNYNYSRKRESRARQERLNYLNDMFKDEIAASKPTYSTQNHLIRKWAEEDRVIALLEEKQKLLQNDKTINRSLKIEALEREDQTSLAAITKVFEAVFWLSLPLSIYYFAMMLKVYISDTIKYNMKTKPQRIGSVLCVVAFASLSMSIVLYMNEYSYSGMDIYDTRELYGVLFCLGIFLVVLGVGLLHGAFQKVLAWIHAGE